MAARQGYNHEAQRTTCFGILEPSAFVSIFRLDEKDRRASMCSDDPG